MASRLIDTSWDRELEQCLTGQRAPLRIIVPFIKRGTVQRLISYGIPRDTMVITRFNLADFHAGVSDPEALRLLVSIGARVRGVRGLHAKLFVFGTALAIVTSANLTEAALLRNHEFGLLTDEQDLVDGCIAYFTRLWDAAGADLDASRIDSWEPALSSARATAGSHPPQPALPDDGVELRPKVKHARTTIQQTAPDASASGKDQGPGTVVSLSKIVAASSGYLKFWGSSSDRVSPASSVLEEVQRAGSHLVCCFPRDRRPRAILTGTTVFMGCLVAGPDVLVYGRATALRPNVLTDNATPSDIVLRSWRSRYPHYIRIVNPEYLSGKLADGVSLNAMFSALGQQSFESTDQPNSSNRNPRKAMMQKAGMWLTTTAVDWLNERLDKGLEECGALDADVLDAIE